MDREGRLLFRLLGRIPNWYPELRLCRDAAERRGACEELARRFGKRRSTLLAAVWFVVWVAVFVTTGMKTFGHPAVREPEVRAVYMAASGLILLIGPVGLVLHYRTRARRELRQILVERGATICVHCGYDLRGQTEPRCPECGREFDPALLNKPSPREARLPAMQPDAQRRHGSE